MRGAVLVRIVDVVADKPVACVVVDHSQCREVPFRDRGRSASQAGCLPVGQQVNGAAGFDVDEDGAVVADRGRDVMLLPRPLEEIQNRSRQEQETSAWRE